MNDPIREAWEKEKQWHHQQIKEANDQVIDAVGLLEVRVIAAREVGVPWMVIADAIGVKYQSAMERFKRLPELEDTRT